MADIRNFVAQEDRELLRHWIRTVCAKEAMSLSRLISQMETWMDKQKWPDARMSATSLKRFINPANTTAASRSAEQLKGVWHFLASKPQYMQYFRDAEIIDRKPVLPSPEVPDAFLAFALTNFFREGNDVSHTHKLEAMKQSLVGKFVLYRPNLEPASFNESTIECVRVSLLEIGESAAGLFIKETQHFRKTRNNRREHHQVNSGVLFPCGQYLIAIMNVENGVSFRCMVIDKIISVFDRSPINEFRGKILVASSRASFPSVKFVCKRSTGKDKHGIYSYKVIDKDIASLLKTPTFDKKKYPVVS